VDDALLERLDQLVEVMKKSPDYQGLDINRSVAIRALVLRGLAAFELRLGIAGDLPRDFSVATQAHWNQREQEAEQELEAIRRFIDEYESKYWSAALDVTASYEDPPKPRSKFYQDRAKKP
jgi:hypothetical protein